MGTDETILRVSATWHLTVEVGDRVLPGQKVNEGPQDESSRAIASGVVKSIRFDPDHHEFVVVIAPAL
jgi:hypothetical protein